METKHLSAKEAMELAVQKREKELSLDVIMESIRERALNGFDYWMTFGGNLCGIPVHSVHRP